MIQLKDRNSLSHFDLRGKGCKKMAGKTATIAQPKSLNPRLEAYKTFWKRLIRNKAAAFGGFLILLFVIMSLVVTLFGRRQYPI